MKKVYIFCRSLLTCRVGMHRREASYLKTFLMGQAFKWECNHTLDI